MHAARLPVALDLTSLSGKVLAVLVWEQSWPIIFEGKNINEQKGFNRKTSLAWNNWFNHALRRQNPPLFASLRRAQKLPSWR